MILNVKIYKKCEEFNLRVDLKVVLDNVGDGLRVGGASRTANDQVIGNWSDLVGGSARNKVSKMMIINEC
jgi:hypothetical protein